MDVLVKTCKWCYNFIYIILNKFSIMLLKTNFFLLIFNECMNIYVRTET